MELENLIEELKEENVLLRNSLKNVNILCSGLTQSNQIMVSQIQHLENEVHRKFNLVSKFLVKNGFSVEDILEFQTEINLDEDLEE
jgi:hypothetical protein